MSIIQGVTWTVMICDSQQGFEFSWLNSLWSWAYSWQDKQIKINGIIDECVTFKQYESYLNTEHWTMVIIFLFCIDYIHIVQNRHN